MNHKILVLLRALRQYVEQMKQIIIRQLCKVITSTGADNNVGMVNQPAAGHGSQADPDSDFLGKPHTGLCFCKQAL